MAMLASSNLPFCSAGIPTVSAPSLSVTDAAEGYTAKYSEAASTVVGKFASSPSASACAVVLPPSQRIEISSPAFQSTLLPDSSDFTGTSSKTAENSTSPVAGC